MVTVPVWHHGEEALKKKKPTALNQGSAQHGTAPEKSLVAEGGSWVETSSRSPWKPLLLAQQRPAARAAAPKAHP